MNWKKWLRELIQAAIAGAATPVTVMIVDPASFNLQEGLPKLGTVCLVSAIFSVAMYLKKSPIPNGE